MPVSGPIKEDNVKPEQRDKQEDKKKPEQQERRPKDVSSGSNGSSSEDEVTALKVGKKKITIRWKTGKTRQYKWAR
jgi:hypothetical protein